MIHPTFRTVYRTVPLGTARLVSTPLPAKAHLVRIHPSPDSDYDRMIVVTENDEGLFLSGWIGKPLTPQEWRVAAQALFPKAKYVEFERKIGKKRRHARLLLETGVVAPNPSDRLTAAVVTFFPMLWMFIAWGLIVWACRN